MRNLIFGIVFFCPPFFKKIILKLFCGARFGRGSRIGWFSSVIGDEIEFGDFSNIKSLTLIRCDGDVRLGNYTEVSSFSLIYGCGNFNVGNKCYIGPQSLINVTEDVVIGNEVGIGPRSMIFTHGAFLPYTEGYWVRFGKVTIGNNVWLAAGVFIHPGIEIGNDVFVNSRSVITENISAGKVLEGFPAREITEMEKLRRSVSPERKDVLILQVIKHFTDYISKIHKKSHINPQTRNEVNIKFNGKKYLIRFIGSKNDTRNIEIKNNKNHVFLFNTRDFQNNRNKNIMYFDFITMKASYSKDSLFKELYLFMKQYYGLIFEYDLND